MLKIGITGGIGSGKSTVTSLFARLGVPVFDSDKVARKLIDSDSTIKNQIIRAFGPEAYLPGSGGLDRKRIGSLVFADPKKLEVLNSITHPPVIQAAADWLSYQQQQYKKYKKLWIQQRQAALVNQESLPAAPVCYVIKEAALLFESGTDRSLDFIIGIYADREVRTRRIIQRDRLNQDEAQRRIDNQMDEEQKMALCGGVIVNNGVHLLWPQVIFWHRKFQTMQASAENGGKQTGF